MADEGATDEQPISFHIKTAGDAKYTVKVPLSMSVSGLKQLLSTEEYANLPADRQRLIYSGRVLKDGDTLATYKIKEGNTVHLVKAAQSNAQNQTSGGGPASTTTGSSGSNPTPPLPSMAAGTGANNLLAGLTGARFAGLAQLPNQSMFGPDGGMGAPPDPEEAIRRLEDPEARRQLNEALSNPAVLDEMIRQNPMLANIPNARQMLQSPMFREMMTNPDMIRQSMRMHRAMGGSGMGGASPGSASSFQAPGGVESGEGGSAGGGGAGATGQQGQPPSNPFAAMFGMPPGSAGAAGGGAENPFAALLNPGMFGAGGAQGQQGGEGGQEGAANRDMPQSPFASPFANPMAQQMARNMMNNPQLMQQMMQSMFAPPPGAEQGQAGEQGREGASSATTAAGAGGSSEGTTDQQQQQPINPFAALLGGGMPGGAGVNPFASMFGDMGAFGGGGGGSSGPPDNRPPEERYADQLRQLNDMGFYDFDQNIAALRRSGGSVQGAVNYLLGG